MGGGGGPFTAGTVSQVSSGPVSTVDLEGVGHYVALEAPEQLAAAILDFTRRVDAGGHQR